MIADRPLSAGPVPAGMRLLSFAARAMGSPLRLTLGAGNTADAERRATSTWDAVREEFAESEQAMSRFRDTSEITVLNRRAGQGRESAVSRRLMIALAASDRAHRMSNGRFDPRVLTDLERLGDHGSPIGDDGRSATPKPLGRLVERLPGDVVRLARPVDLGGIGKGLALRWAAAIVRRSGFDAFLLDAGGDLVVDGSPPEDGPWRIGIEDPAGDAEPLAIITARGEAVATSSVRRRTWTLGDRTVHHLIDPRTGEPGGDGLLAVTVVGPDPAWAEVWSKVLFLDGRTGIAEHARRRGLAAWWVPVDGPLEMTPSARTRTLWTADQD